MRAGIRTQVLDKLVVEEMRRRGVVASFKGYQGYPASVCVSINDEVVHGIPGSRVIREGDVVSIDLGVFHKGFHTDAALTSGCRPPSERAARLMEVTRESLAEGIKFVRAGNHVGDISQAVQRYVEAAGFAVVREYTGHRVGRNFHEDPQVPNFVETGERERGALLRAGMTLAIEPMVTAGGWQTGWQQTDGRYSPRTVVCPPHFEHSVASGRAILLCSLRSRFMAKKRED